MEFCCTAFFVSCAICLGGAAMRASPGGEDAVQGSGIVFEFETEVVEVRESPTQGFPVQVTLSNGSTYGCDFVVSATGVVPQVDALPAEVCSFLDFRVVLLHRGRMYVCVFVWTPPLPSFPLAVLLSMDSSCATKKTEVPLWWMSACEYSRWEVRRSWESMN